MQSNIPSQNIHPMIVVEKLLGLLKHDDDHDDKPETHQRQLLM
jgi:hypothetical protein